MQNKPTTNRGNYGNRDYKQIKERKCDFKDNNCNIMHITVISYPGIRGKTI